jgi:hypothetical protein
MGAQRLRVQAGDRSAVRKMEDIMTIRLLTITAVTLSVVSGAAYAGKPGWNQVAADAAARAYAAEGKCYPANGPCPAPQPTLHPYRTPHVHNRKIGGNRAN